MLTADGNAGRAVARHDDVVHEPRKGRHAADEEGGHSAPIGRELGRVPVHAVEVVHVGHGDFAAAHDVVAVVPC